MWVEETKNGNFKFVERYTDTMTGKQKKISVTMAKNNSSTRKAASEELQRKIHYATNKYPSELTLKQLYDIYISHQEQHLKASTVRRNKISLNRVITLLHSDVIVNKITAQYVRDKLSEQGTKTNEYITRFKAMINWGYENELIDNISLTRKLKVVNEISEHQKVKYKFLEPDEVKKLLEYMEHSIPEWYYLTKFLVLSGLRVGEAVALNTNDVDDYIHVSKTYDPNNLVLTTPKTAESNRDVYVQPELAELIKTIRIYMHDVQKSSKISSSLFMHNVDGCILSYYAYKKHLKKCAAASLGYDITPHILRHTHASILLAQGVDTDTISRRLGHSDSRITKEIYLHVTKQLKERDNQQVQKTKIL